MLSNIYKIKKVLQNGILLFIVFATILVYVKTNDKKDFQQNANILDGCKHVYLDVGSNIGIQVRKLFEPHLYPNAEVLNVFSKYFGFPKHRNWGTLCAVGFEPNPNHSRILKTLEKHYQDCGFRVYFLTETAVSNQNGEANFVSDQNYEKLEYGGSVIRKVDPLFNYLDQLNNDKIVSVKMLRLSDFIVNTVAKRSIPGNGKGKVVIKLDVEGSEVEVIPDLIFTGSLQYLNSVMIEWHPHSFPHSSDIRMQLKKLKNIFDRLDEYSRFERTVKMRIKPVVNNLWSDFRVLNMDDESYFSNEDPYPTCDRDARCC